MADDVNVWGEDSPSLLVVHRTLIGRSSPVLGAAEFIDAMDGTYRAYEVRYYGAETDSVAVPSLQFSADSGVTYTSTSFALTPVALSLAGYMDGVVTIVGADLARDIHVRSEYVETGTATYALALQNIDATIYDSLKINIGAADTHLTGEFYLFGIDKLEP